MHYQPVVYEHAARFVDAAPEDVSRDPELLAEAHILACQEYSLRRAIVAIDLYTLEPEWYGAEVGAVTDGGVPLVTAPVCKTPGEILLLQPVQLFPGRWSVNVQAAAFVQKSEPGVEVRLPLSGPVALAVQLMGLEPFLFALIDAPDDVRIALDFLTAGQMRLAKALSSLGMRVAVFESSAAPPLLSPAQFRQIVLPYLEKLIRVIRQLGDSTVPCILGGDTALIAEDLATCGAAHLICPAETDQDAFLRRTASADALTIRANIDAAVFTAGDPKAALEEAARICALAGGYENVEIGTGVLPVDSDPALVKRVGAFVESQGRPPM